MNGSVECIVTATSSSPTTCGRRLRAVRKRAKQTQDTFGSSLGYSKRSVNSWEQGRAALPISLLAKLRQLYDVDPEWITSGTDETPVARFAGVDWPRLDRLLRHIGDHCREASHDLNPVQQRALARILYDSGAEADDATSRRLTKLLTVLARMLTRSEAQIDTEASSMANELTT